MIKNTRKLSQLIIKTLDNNKAINITKLDIRELSDMMDEMIICSATSTRHATALANKVIEIIEEHGYPLFGLEGEEEGEWVLIDCYDVVVHIMLPTVREFYNLEKLWGMSKDPTK